MTNPFLTLVYMLAARSPRKALWQVFKHMDEWHLEGHFVLSDAVLLDVDLNQFDKTNIEVPLGILSITAAAKSKLQNREAFYQRMEAWLRQVDPERMDQLLIGLR